MFIILYYWLIEDVVTVGIIWGELREKACVTYS